MKLLFAIDETVVRVPLGLFSYSSLLFPFSFLSPLSNFLFCVRLNLDASGVVIEGYGVSWSFRAASLFFF